MGENDKWGRWQVILGVIGLVIAIYSVIPHSASTPPQQSFISVSSPVGASIYLDNKYKGEVPQILNNIKLGSHLITLKIAGYEDWSQTISVDAGETVSISPTLTPKTSPTPEETSIPEVTYIPVQTSTPALKQAVSNYQDTEWLATFSTDSQVITSEITDITTATTSFNDYNALSISNSLYTDSQKAMENSDLYNVSSGLQGAKDEYRLSLVQVNWFAVNSSKRAEESAKGNLGLSIAYTDKAIKCLESHNQHMNKAYDLITAYKSSHSSYTYMS